MRGGNLEHMGRLSGGCGEAIWGYGECLEGVQGHLQDVEMLSRGFGEVFLRVWGGCPDIVCKVY